MKKTSKILSFVLALVMVFSLSAIVPLTANAAQTDRRPFCLCVIEIILSYYYVVSQSFHTQKKIAIKRIGGIAASVDTAVRIADTIS